MTACTTARAKAINDSQSRQTASKTINPAVTPAGFFVETLYPGFETGGYVCGLHTKNAVVLSISQ